MGHVLGSARHALRSVAARLKHISAQGRPTHNGAFPSQHAIIRHISCPPPSNPPPSPPPAYHIHQPPPSQMLACHMCVRKRARMRATLSIECELIETLSTEFELNETLSIQTLSIEFEFIKHYPCADALALVLKSFNATRITKAENLVKKMTWNAQV